MINVRKKKRVILLVLAAVLCIALCGCGEKYESASDAFTVLDKFDEGNFTLSVGLRVVGDQTLSYGMSAKGVASGNDAVFSLTEQYVLGDDVKKEEYDQVLAKNRSELKKRLMYAMLSACGKGWEKDQSTYKAGSSETADASLLFDFMAGFVKEAGSGELAMELSRVSEDVLQEGSTAEISADVKCGKKEFVENAECRIDLGEYKVELDLKYSFKPDKISYSSSDEYVTIKTAATNSFYNYKEQAAAAGIYKDAESEVTSHLASNDTLIIQGIDEKYYKTTWNPSDIEFAAAEFEYGMWNLSFKGEEGTTIQCRMYENTVDGLLDWYGEVFGEQLDLDYTRETVGMKAGQAEHIIMTRSLDELDYVTNMFLFTIGDNFLVQVEIQNTTDYTDEELVNLAFEKFEVYGE